MSNLNFVQQLLPLAENLDKKPYSAKTILDVIMGWIKLTLKIVGDAILSFGDFTNSGALGLNVENFVTNFSSIFVAFGYTFVILFWGLHIVENATTMDLFTARGGVKAFIRLFLGKAFVDLAIPICYGILNVVMAITTEVVKQADTLSDLMPENMGSEYSASVRASVGSIFPGDKIPIIGGVINSINDLLIGIFGLLFLIPLILILVAVGFMFVGSMVKLTLKMAEFAILITISPSFFACLASDVTKEYFRRFITTFLSIAIEIIYMALVYAMMTFVHAEAGDAGSSSIGFYEFLGVYILKFTFILAMGFMLVKPPSFLKNIVS